jgi:hypothetical protein
MSKVHRATPSQTAEIEMTQQGDVRPTMAAKGQSWHIPHEGRSAKLELTQSVFGKTVIADLDGVQVRGLNANFRTPNTRLWWH